MKKFFIIVFTICQIFLTVEKLYADSSVVPDKNTSSESTIQELKTNSDTTANTNSLNISEVLYPKLPLNYEYTKEGVEIIYNKKIKNAKLFFRQYNELSQANAFGKMEEGKKLFSPYGSTICFWLEYDDGIKSRTEIFYVRKKTYTKTNEESLMQVFSPMQGHWKNEQVLNISAEPKTTIYYSLDGSEPEKFGQIYYKPFVIEKRGQVNIKLKAISPEGKIESKEINYNVSPRGRENNSAFEFLNSIPKKEKLEKQMPYNILAWNYLEFILQAPVHYELSTKNTKPTSFENVYKEYLGPIFLDRNEDIFVFWSCETFDEGRVQKIFLPAKPKISLSESITTSKPISVKLSDSRYAYTFTCGDIFMPVEPEINSHKFENYEKTFSLNEGDEFHYNLRVKAFYDNVPHGEFFTEFIIDRKKPPKIEPIFSSQEKSSNEAITMSLPDLPASVDYFPVVKITPEAKQLDSGEYILNGIDYQNTNYRILAYYEDRAGNRGEVFQKEISITPFSIYVNSEKGSSRGDGSVNKPFAKLQDAFNFIKNQKDKAGSKKIWTIFVEGEFNISNAIFISDKIELNGKQAVFNLKTNVGFVLEKAEVSFSNINFVRKEHEDEPRNVPFIYSSNGILNLRDISFNATNGGTVVSLFNTNAFLKNINCESSQKKYTECFLINKSEVIFENFDFNLNCNSAVALACKDSLCQIVNSNFVLNSATACRVLDLKNTNANLNFFTAKRLPDVYNTDICISFDASSDIKLERINISGFKYETKQ
ncbi:MAG: FN3 associated domain-containing protein [Treponemataceae bacterium]